MREAAFHVPHEAIEAMGFDVSLRGFRGVDVRDVTPVSCEGPESVVAITYSEPVDDALSDSDTVEWWERVDREGPDATYLCRIVAPELPGETPGEREREGEWKQEQERKREGERKGDLTVQGITVEADGCTVTVVGSQEAIRCHGEFDGNVDAPVSLRRLADYEGPRDELDALTSRQREVLETAYDLGYYEVPRETTAGKIARRFDLDRSTVTEHLQRAERNVLSALLSG